MSLFLAREQRTDSAASVESSDTRSSKPSLQAWYSKRKRTSPSPSPPSEGFTTASSRASTWSRSHVPKYSRSSSQAQRASPAELSSRAQDSVVVSQQKRIPQGYITPQMDQNHGLGQSEHATRLISLSRPAWPGRRRSSARLSEIRAPQAFTVEELAKPLTFSKPTCPMRVGHIYRPHPEPGLRVVTKSRSPESCFTTTHPIYSVRHHSPKDIGKPFTIYYEGEIRPSNSEDGARLALGFAMGKDRASRLPGLEPGSIGIHCRDGSLYMNGYLLKGDAMAVPEPGERFGIGLTFLGSDSNDGQLISSSSSIDVEVFLSKDRERIGSWNLGELMRSADLQSEGFDGSHDLYAAIGTHREVNADILFDRIDWRFLPEAG